MSELSQLLELPEAERAKRGLVHTPNEIAQQPSTWAETFDLFRSRMAEIQEFLSSKGIEGSTKSNLTVFLIGAGSSDYIGCALTHLLQSTWQCEVLAVPSTDLLTHMDELVLSGRKYLWISFSRSGDSPEGVAVLSRARQRYPEIPHIVISCNANGRMLRDSAGDPRVLGICLSDAANDRGLAMTSSVTNMIIFGQCLANAGDLQGYEPLFSHIVAAGKSFLPYASDCAAALAREGFTKAFFVGSGPLRAAARESALKLLELTAGRTLTMSESALGLRHGPMAALDRDCLFVCFLSGKSQVQAYERDLLRELGSKQLGRRRVVISGSEQAFDSYADIYLAPGIPVEIPDEYRVPVDLIFGQLLGLFSSIQWGLMPDQPSPTGVISRVVQNVSIHG